MILDLIVAEERAIGEQVGIALQFGRRLLRIPVVAGGLALLAFGYFISVRAPETRWSGGGGQGVNIVHVAEESLARAREGTIRPAIVTDEPQEIGKFFRQHGAHFASAGILPLRGEWYGAALTEHNGIQLAHLVCKVGDDLMYVFEVREGDVGRDADFHLPVGVTDGIGRRGWFSDRGLGGNSVVFWRENEALCAAASTMKPQELLAVLALREGR
jgi:hypothetical protein